MKLLKIHTILFMVLALAAAVHAEPVRVSVETAAPGSEISPRMMGLSYETSLLRAGTNGIRYFRPDNKALVTVLKTIGVKGLRIGGASVDSTKLPVPSEEDITSLFGLAKEAGVKVIYSVRGAESKDVKVSDNVALATRAAELIRSRFKEQLDLFSIGNEPYYWLRDHDQYVGKWKILRDAVLAGFPEAEFCAADEGPMPDLVHKMASAYGNPAGRLVTISQHSYPFGSSYKNNTDPSDLVNRIPHDATESRAKMLSPAAYKTYEKIYKEISAAIEGTLLPFRITECNSFSSSGLKGASDSYAAALWAVDYLNWWANHGVDGMYFHTGDRTGGDANFICRYAAFRTSEHGYDVYPLAYGMKLFDLGGHGRVLPVAVVAGTDQKLVAYATLSEGKTVAVTLINKTHGPEANEQALKIKLDQPLDGSVQMISLCGRNNDISGSLGDVTLGGAQIKEDGTWAGQWTRLPPSAITKDEITVTMPPASAAVLKFSTK